MTNPISCTFFRGTLSDFYKIFYFLLLSVAVFIFSTLHFNLEVVYVLPFFIGVVMIFAVFFARFRFKKGNYLPVGTCEIADDALDYCDINRDIFKKIPFDEIQSVKFNHVFAYDDKNKQIIFTLHNAEKWTMITNTSGVELILGALKNCDLYTDSLRKIPLYMHFITLLILFFYIYIIYLQLFEPDKVSIRTIIISITVLPVLAYYFKLRNEAKG